MLELNKSEEKTVWKQDKDHFLHPWTMFDSFNQDGALAIAEGEGVYIKDVDGNRYLDAVGGLWCTNIGLGRQEMADAISDQVMKLAFSNPFVDMTNVPAAQLAEKLAELAPDNINHVFFTTGGSTAVDSAYRLIQYYQACRGKPEKEHIISRKNSYHGSTYASMSIGGKKGDHPPEFKFMDDTIHHISAPDYYRAPEGLSEADFLEQMVRELEDKILELGADRVAAFFAEPVMGAGGVIVPPGDYNKRTWDICKKYDVLYVADEVVTSFGRLGHWFASEAIFGIQPDIITTAKGLSSGYLPIGAMLYCDEIHDVISETGHGRCFAHGFTYSGHPVACAAALKNIEILERENIFAKVKEVGPYFEERLKGLLDLPIVGDVRGLKMMMCVEFVQDKDTKELFPEELDIGKLVSNQADARGLIVRPVGNLNIMSPPLILTRDDVDFIVDTLRESIVAAQEELRT